jgi:hypothetical protein
VSTADEGDVTATLFDGTFSTEAVAAAGHALVEQLFDEAMATIAALAENWDSPDAEPAVAEEEPVALVEPASWSVTEDDEDDVRALAAFELPALLSPARQAEAAA